MSVKKSTKTTKSTGSKTETRAQSGSKSTIPKSQAVGGTPPGAGAQAHGQASDARASEAAKSPQASVKPPRRERTQPTKSENSGDPTPGLAIDALEVMRRAEDEKRAARSGQTDKPTHMSAAQAIAKAHVRDHAERSQPLRKAAAISNKPAPRPSRPVDVPAEPSEPIAGLGAEGLPPPPVDSRDVEAVLNADHRDPFSFLGMHSASGEDSFVVRVFLPQASAVEVLEVANGNVAARLEKVHDEGLFVGAISGRRAPFPYRLRVRTLDGEKELEDPYAFSLVLGEDDVKRLSEMDHLTSYQLLGAHVTEMRGVAGTSFAVWAPNASHVAVVGDFNEWDGRRHGMRLRHECGVWEIFIPGVGAGDLYKYEIKPAPGAVPIVKCDPYAFEAEPPPATASVVRETASYRWGDAIWMKQRKERHPRSSPQCFYEAHLGSWRRKPEEGHRWLSYREMASELVDYLQDVGYTHLALLPISEHTFDDTVGYLPSALFAPTSRYGTPDDLRFLVDACHRAGIGVVVDWVPNILSSEIHGLTLFDGTALYEDTSRFQSRDPDWDMPTYNLASPAVVSYLISNALYWLEEFHLDGLRIESLAKLLYRDYGRSEGQWEPNSQGGNENLEALAFIRRLNQEVHDRHPGVLMIAEDSSLRQGMTQPVSDGGLGFDLRWNSSWVYDTLRYLQRHPVHRKYYHYELVAPLSYAFDESFLFPVAHDHVAIGQGALVNKLPGDRWGRFATLRAWLGLMYALPGKKLTFMGTEFAQDREWNSTISLDWHLLQDSMHLGVQRLVRDLNRLVRQTPSLHALDADPRGFEWIDTSDEDNSVISFVRNDAEGGEVVVAITHFTPVVRPNYRIGVPREGYYREALNTDAETYGGGNWGSEGGAMAERHSSHGREHSLCLTLPPYATVILQLQRDAPAAG